MTLHWATLSEYMEAQLSDTNATFPEMYPGVDFVPYDFLDFWAFWSGYFTSRPVLKGIIRSLHAERQAAERLYTLAKILGPKGMRACAVFPCCAVPP